MAEKFQAPKGTYDVLPMQGMQGHSKKAAESWTVSANWIWLEQVLRKVALEFGFQEIRTPVFEATGVFSRTAGDSSDVVSKEMYTFEDRGGRSLSLRPEGTAPAARALIEAGFLQPGMQARVFYIESMFRYERPQSGRFRQHTQFGAEWFGADAPEAEVECIQLMWQLYNQLGLRGLSFHINSLGTRADRAAYRDQLLKYLTPRASALSEESRERLEKNPLRILDTKSPQDLEILKDAPQLFDSLSIESKNRFERVISLLNELEIPHVVQPRLVRGFDYYTHTVWELVAQGIGAQGSVGGGGRYDHLVQELGGPSCPGIGFGMGLERLLAVLQSEGLPLGPSLAAQIIVVPMEEQLVAQAMKIASEFRQLNRRVELTLEARRLKHIFSRASDQGTRWVVLLGSDEAKNGTLSLKDLSTGIQSQLSLSEALQLLAQS